MSNIGRIIYIEYWVNKEKTKQNKVDSEKIEPF